MITIKCNPTAVLNPNDDNSDLIHRIKHQICQNISKELFKSELFDVKITMIQGQYSQPFEHRFEATVHILPDSQLQEIQGALKMMASSNPSMRTELKTIQSLLYNNA